MGAPLGDCSLLYDFRNAFYIVKFVKDRFTFLMRMKTGLFWVNRAVLLMCHIKVKIFSYIELSNMINKILFILKNHTRCNTYKFTLEKYKTNSFSFFLILNNENLYLMKVKNF